jgi:cellulose synthase/poly-beta-1,6-N-acetylglucosamine synthase-like glycosyltransferase
MIVDIVKGGFDPGYVEAKGEVLFHPYFPTANAAFRKSALLQIGGFDEALKTGEDVDVAIRLAHAGHLLWFEPTATVDHFHRTSVWQLMRQWYGYGAYHPALIRKHGARRTLDVYRLTTKLASLPFPFPGLVFLSWLLAFHAFLLMTPLSSYFLIPASLCLARYIAYRPRHALLRYLADVAFMLGGLRGSLRFAVLYVPASRERSHS